MNEISIRSALVRAQRGIEQYRELMALVSRVDVSLDLNFQRKYNAFYRVQRRQASWYRSYYGMLQALKGTQPRFPEVLDRIYAESGRYEPSFASKLVATLDPSKPVWDVHVLANTKHRAPSYSDRRKLSRAKLAYESIMSWYEQFLKSADGRLCINVFNSVVPRPQDFTDVKKVDFILWQTRSGAETE